MNRQEQSLDSVNSVWFYTMLSSLRRSHGGLTSASIRRVEALSRRGYHSIVAVAEYVDSLEVLEEELRITGEISDSEIRCMYHDICAWPELVTGWVDHESLSERPPEPTVVESQAGSVRMTAYLGSTGSTVISEFSLASGGERWYSVFDERGNTIASCSNWELRRRWFRWLDRSHRSVFFIDGVSMGQALAPVQLENGVKYLMQHGAHLSGPSGSPRLKHNRVAAIRHAETFGAIFVQTQRQAESFRDLVGHRAQVRVLPNINTDPGPMGLELGTVRPPIGVIVTRLDENQKQVSHLLQVIEMVCTRAPTVSFEVFGEGAGRWSSGSLNAWASEHGLSDQVTFHGHTDGASKHFERGLFTVMTSRHEGFPLTLVEAASRGCIPISYDIDYGPSDLIQNGENGFLIPSGGVIEACERIQEIVDDEGKARSMRSAAVASSRLFSADVVVDQLVDWVNSDLE